MSKVKGNDIDICRQRWDEIQRLNKEVERLAGELDESCHRFHTQVTAADGVLVGAKTIAQLEFENTDYREVLELLGDLIHGGPEAVKNAIETARALKVENERLTALLNTPETEDFDKAIPLEAAHQVERWGSGHDAGKQPQDWFWLLGYLGGKALASHLNGDLAKAKHHCISSAAVLRNWHAHIRSGESQMRPGIGEDKTSALETK